MTARTIPQPAIEPVAGGYRARLRYGKGLRDRFFISAPDDRSAEKKVRSMQEMANLLTRSGNSAEAPLLLRRAGEAHPERFRAIEKIVEALAVGKVKAVDQRRKVEGTTFRQLADQWTSGELHRQFPDHVKLKRSVDDDAARLARLFKTLGDLPLAELSVADAERAMAALPPKLSSGSRRQYAQLIARILKLAAYPCRIIPQSPLPKGFLPRVESKKAKSFLYPAEELQLLQHVAVPIGRRVLYGLLAREGLRLGEAVALRWADLDLERGTVRLDENKTDDPRMWALGRDVLAALQAYRAQDAPADSLVFPGLEQQEQAARVFRQDLTDSGVKRAELFEASATRLAIRVHDLRGTFVTLALATGRTETWVSDRTGHKSSAMIQRYRRAARSASELGLGWLEPMNVAIPELAPKPKGGPESGPTPALTNQAGTPKSATPKNKAEVAEWQTQRIQNPPR